MPKSRALSVLASNSCFFDSACARPNGKMGRGARRPEVGKTFVGQVAWLAGQENVEWWNAPRLLIGVASRQAQAGSLLAGAIAHRSRVAIYATLYAASIADIPCYN